MAFSKVLTEVLAAAAATGIATSQSGTASTPLTLNGSLVTGGVAKLNSGGIARRVIVTSAGNDSSITFTIVGTDVYGRPQTEVLTGGDNSVSSGVAQTNHDFATVTSITPSGNTASTVTAGTNGVGSTIPWIVDAFPNPSFFGGDAIVTGSATYNIEGSYDDYTPYWNLNTNTPNWFTIVDGTAGTNQNYNFNFGGTMLRLTVLSGTGTVTAHLKQSYAGKTVS